MESYFGVPVEELLKPNSKSLGVIGHSDAADMIITVHIIPKDWNDIESGRWWGTNAWRANRRDEKIYREG